MPEEESAPCKILVKTYTFLKKLASPFIKVFSWACNYTGVIAEIVKAIPVFMMLALILYPFLSLPLFMELASIYGEPLNYVIYLLWISQIFIILLVNAYIEYLKKNRN